MKFTVNTKQFTKLLRAVVSDGGSKGLERNPLLRLAAQDNTITIGLNDLQAGCEAEVAQEGVCFLRYRKFVPLLRSYAQEQRLAITVTAEGIQIGNTAVGAKLLELCFFPDPKTAPAHLSSRVKRRKRSKGSHAQGMLPLENFRVANERTL